MPGWAPRARTLLIRVRATNVNAASTAGNYTFSVEYKDSDGTIDAASIGTGNVTVAKGGTQLTVTNAVIASGSGTNDTVVNYTATPPGGTWDSPDDGTYTVAIVANQVKDNLGGAVAANAAAKTFSVDTTPPSAPNTAIVLDTASDSFAAPGTNSDDITKVVAPSFTVSLAGTGALAGNSVELLLGGASLAHVVTHTLTGGDITAGSVDLTVTSGDLGTDGTKTLTARVTDAAGNVGTAGGSLSITLDTAAPAAGTGTLTVAEGSGTGSAVGTVTSTGASSFSLSDNDGGRFAINATTGAVTVASGGALLDYESHPTESITVVGKDLAGNSTSTTMSVAITDVAPAITAGQTFSIAYTAANNAAVGTAANTGDTSSVTWSISVDPSGGLFKVDNSGNIKIADKTKFDYANHQSYTETLQATDGTTISTQTVVINITAPPPTFSSANTASVAETAATSATVIDVDATKSGGSTPDANITYSITGGNTGNAFSINSATGVITVAAALDYEVLHTYTLTVHALDDFNASADQTLTVTVTDVHPTITASQTLSVSICRPTAPRWAASPAPATIIRSPGRSKAATPTTCSASTTPAPSPSTMPPSSPT